MEEMKNLVIQTLETRGVLGQIRAKLRSAVFKVVDDQDQRSNPPMGCGLNWENPLLYKIKETNLGGVISELIREFMEYLKMDYSLSVFIPECSISPERLKKEEIMAKLGMSINNFNSDLPIIFFIIHYFIESLQSNPQSVYDSLNKIANSDVEKYSDDTIIRNLYNYQTSNFNENEEALNNQKNNLIEDKKYSNDVYGEEEWSNREQVLINNANDNNVDDNVSVKKQKNDFEKLNDSEIENPIRRSFEFEDRRTNSALNNLDLNTSKGRNESKNYNKNENDNDIEIENYKNILNSNNIPVHNNSDKLYSEDFKNQNNNTDNDDIIEEIMIEEDEFEKSSDKKISSSNLNYTISQSGGFDGTVDSNALEKYNYIEPIEK